MILIDYERLLKGIHSPLIKSHINLYYVHVTSYLGVKIFQLLRIASNADTYADAYVDTYADAYAICYPDACAGARGLV